MDTEDNTVRTGPAENLDFTEADWLEEMSRARFGAVPYDERLDRTIQDMMTLRGIGYKTARDFLEAETKAGRLARRDVIINGKRTAVYRPSSSPW